MSRVGLTLHIKSRQTKFWMSWIHISWGMVNALNWYDWGFHPSFICFIFGALCIFKYSEIICTFDQLMWSFWSGFCCEGVLHLPGWNDEIVCQVHCNNKDESENGGFMYTLQTAVWIKKKTTNISFEAALYKLSVYVFLYRWCVQDHAGGAGSLHLH